MRPIIKWTGSKRYLAKSIETAVFSQINWDKISSIYEPFVGGGSLLPYYPLNKNVYASDVFITLIEMWNEIKTSPNVFSEEYRLRWTKLQTDGDSYYYDVRKNFNITRSKYDFFFLTRTCENGLIRFNRKGEFNASFHVTRPGINPLTLNQIIDEWHQCIQRIDFKCMDYGEAMASCDNSCVMFLDPPYNTQQSFYINQVFDENLFFDNLERLNQNGTKWILTYNSDVPNQLYKQKTKFVSKSSYNRLSKKMSDSFETVFLNF